MSEECSVHQNAAVEGERPRFSHGAHLLGALAAKRGLPMGVHLQIADRCNHACVHCYQIQGLKGELDLAGVCRVIDDLAEAGVLALSVSGGEATLRPDLLDILRHARGRGFAIRLYTNGFTVDAKLAGALAEIGLLEVHVSVYSTLAEEHDAVTRVPGSLQKTLSGVRRMREAGLRVILKTPMVALACQGAAGVKALAASMGCGFSAGTDLTAMEDGSLDPLAVRAGNEQLAQAGLLKGWVPGSEQARLHEERLGQAACGVGASGVVVLPNGDVLPCTDTPVVLGNLTTAKLNTVLNETPDAALFRGLTLGDVHGCRDCALLVGCKRCHATALHEGGDYLGPYLSACDRTLARYALGLGHAVTVLDPAEGCDATRDRRVGPFEILSPGVVLPVVDRITEEDQQRADAFRWIRKKSPDMSGQIVTLRRKDGAPLRSEMNNAAGAGATPGKNV